MTTPSNVLPLHLKQTSPPIIFNDGIKSRLPSKIFSTLCNLSSKLRPFEIFWSLRGSIQLVWNVLLLLQRCPKAEFEVKTVPVNFVVNTVVIQYCRYYEIYWNCLYMMVTLVKRFWSYEFRKFGHSDLAGLPI